MTITIETKYLRAVALFAAKNEIRDYLNGVLVEAHSSGAAFLVASNAHVLAAAHLPTAVAAHHPPQEVIMPSVTVKRLLSFEWLGPEVRLDGAGKDWTLGDDSFSLKFSPVDNKYPKWRDLIRSDKPGNTASFNPAYLAMAAEAAKYLNAGQRNSAMKLHCRGGAATLVRFQDDHFVAVLMPMTINIAEDVPPWIGAPAARRIESVEPAKVSA